MDESQEMERAERFVRMVQVEIQRCAKEISELYGVRVPHKISWTTQGLTAGWCMYPRKGETVCELRFNSKIGIAEGERFRATAAHEFAHAAAWVIWGPGVHHDYRWKGLMRVLGHEAARCHDYASAERARR